MDERTDALTNGFLLGTFYVRELLEILMGLFLSTNGRIDVLLQTQGSCNIFLFVFMNVLC